MWQKISNIKVKDREQRFGGGNGWLGRNDATKSVEENLSAKKWKEKRIKRHCDTSTKYSQ